MILNDLAKKDFENWINVEYVEFSFPDIDLYSQPLPCILSLILEWLDSNGIFIDTHSALVNKYNDTVWFSNIYTFKGEHLYRKDYLNNRNEAILCCISYIDDNYKNIFRKSKINKIL